MKTELEAEFYLSGRSSFTRVRRPEWTDVEELLEKLKDKQGSMRLVILPESDIGPVNIDVSTENGFYLITLLEYSENSSDVRSCWDTSKGNNKIIVLGNYWPECQLTKDFSLVVSIFKEFFETGNVSMDLLN